jgi:DNA-binding transcriptional LysR family regulator
MELRQLRTFQTVARLMNFNRAADALNYAQSTVSAQIKLLEEELGVSLFDRLGKRIVITEAGQKLMRYAQKMIDIEQETLTEISNSETLIGSISVRAPQSVGTYLLPSVLQQFKCQYPRVGFDVSSCALFTLQQELRSGIIDVAFLLAESVNAADLTAELVRIEPLVFVSDPNYALTKSVGMTFRDLNGQSILLPKHDCSYKMQFEEMLTAENISPSVVMEFNSIEAIKQCVIKGLGITVIPEIAVKAELAQNKIKKIPWLDEPLETGVLMIRHKDKWISPALQAFMDISRETMKLSI